MKKKSTLIIMLALWLATWVLLIPYRVSPPEGISFVGLLCGMSMPYDWLESPVAYILPSISYWIGIVVTLVVSGVVIHVAGRGKLAILFVASTDLTVIIVSLLLAWFWRR